VQLLNSIQVHMSLKNIIISVHL